MEGWNIECHSVNVFKENNHYGCVACIRRSTTRGRDGEGARGPWTPVIWAKPPDSHYRVPKPRSGPQYFSMEPPMDDVIDWQWTIISVWRLQNEQRCNRTAPDLQTDVVLIGASVVDVDESVSRRRCARTLTSDLTTRPYCCTRQWRIETASLDPQPSDAASAVVRRQSHVDRRNYVLLYHRRPPHTLDEGYRPRNRDRRRTDQWSAVRYATGSGRPAAVLFHAHTDHCRHSTLPVY